MVGAHAAADDKEIGGEEHLNVRVIALKTTSPRDPIKVLYCFLACRSLSLGIVAIDLEVAELRVGEKDPVIDDRRAGARAERRHENVRRRKPPRQVPQHPHR